MLLLDEPTNHLDAESVAWLERFLHDYQGTVVAVTGYRSCFYRSIPMGPIDNGRKIEMEFLEKEKKFDPEEVYKGQPNPTKV